MSEKTINKITLALGIALLPPIWAVLSPYAGITTGAVALICAGLYVTNGNKVSGVLTSMGLETNEIDSSIRFSFSPLNSKEEIDYAIEVLKEVLPMLRRFTRR